MERHTVHRINRSYWDTKGHDLIGSAVLPLYGAYVSEENYRLLGDISGKKVLEIGCGNGRSPQNLGERAAAELWGTELSEKQIERAGRHLAARGFPARRIRSSMEDNCGFPPDTFDRVYSIYAVGWTSDLTPPFSGSPFISKRAASLCSAGLIPSTSASLRTGAGWFSAKAISTIPGMRFPWTRVRSCYRTVRCRPT